MPEKRRFCVDEQFVTQRPSVACAAIESKYPGLGLKYDGVLMGSVEFSADITEEQAGLYDIDWDSLRC